MQPNNTEWDSVWAEFDAREKAAGRGPTKPAQAPDPGKRGRRRRAVIAYLLGLATPLLIAPVVGMTSPDAFALGSGSTDELRMSRSELMATARALVTLGEANPGTARWAASLHPDFRTTVAAEHIARLAAPVRIGRVTLGAESPLSDR